MAESEAGTEGQQEDLVKKFENLVAKYGMTESLKMFKYFHSPGFSVKHPPEITDNIEYVIEGKMVKVRCRCGTSLDLTDYSKIDTV
jgi:hypothetical protein